MIPWKDFDRSLSLTECEWSLTEIGEDVEDDDEDDLLAIPRLRFPKTTGVAKRAA
jgi:hypothetical protein